jgi:hypothetical protein
MLGVEEDFLVGGDIFAGRWRSNDRIEFYDVDIK